MTLQSKGFSVIGVLVALVVLGALGFSGWYIWHKNQGVAGTQKNVAVSKDASEGGKYVVIEEWGVRFPVPEGLRGDVYYKTFVSEAFGDETGQFASKKLDTLVGNGDCTFLPQADGKVHGGELSAMLGRLDPAHPPKIDLGYYRSQYTFIVKVGSYEYYYANDTKPEVSCATAHDEAASTLESQLSTQLREAFGGLEAINDK